MSVARSRLLVPLALACAAATAGVASAQSSATPAGSFGGGAITVPVTNSAAKDMALSIRAQPNGTIGVGGEVPSRCGRAAIRGRTKLAANGSFTLRATTTRRPYLGVRERSTFVVKGRLAADGGTGTVASALRVRGRGRTRTCKTRTVTWTVRPAADAAAAPAPAPADALLYGLTSQDGPEVNHAVVLHVTRGGRSIDRLLVRFRSRCDKRVIVVSDEINYSPEFDVAADGSFRNVERFKVSFSDVVLRTTVIVRGQFDAAGAVAGKVAVTQRFTNRRNGKRVDVCTTGTLTWAARQ